MQNLQGKINCFNQTEIFVFSYARIVGIYQSKARADAQEIYEIAHKHLELLGLDQAVGSTTKLSLEQCQHFCKHAAKIRLLKGAPMGEGRAKGLEVAYFVPYRGTWLS